MREWVSEWVFDYFYGVDNIISNFQIFIFSNVTCSFMKLKKKTYLEERHFNC